MKNKIVIGIDLGTTNSISAYYRNGGIEIIPNEKGNRLTPSVVYFKNEGNVFVGELAKNQSMIDIENSVNNVKLSMGKDTVFKIRNRDYSPSEISGLILRKIKKYSEEYLGEEIKDAIITVPAYFNDNQRQATLNAARLAGLNVLKLLNEPTAAAIAYGFFNKKESKFLVVDVGGGTTDITILEYKNNVFMVKAIGGNTELGGNNFDFEIKKYIIDTFKEETGIDLSNDKIAMKQISINAEKAKIDLSVLKEVNIVIPYIAVNEKGPVHLNIYLDRKKFEELIKKYIDKIKNIVEDTFRNNNIMYDEIDSILFVGGATRTPAVENVILDIFKNNGCKILEKISPEYEIKRGEICIYRDINRDEAVAIGAGILAGMFEGKINDIKFHDITSHSLGIEDDDGNFIEIIKKGKNYPIEISKLFTTVEDNQKEVLIKVIQKNDDNSIVDLGSFHFELEPKPKGEANIEVVFEIDNNGVLHVYAIDVETGKHKKVIIENNKNFGKYINEKRGTKLEII